MEDILAEDQQQKETSDTTMESDSGSLEPEVDSTPLAEVSGATELLPEATTTLKVNGTAVQREATPTPME